jgi:hypothetical protein
MGVSFIGYLLCYKYKAFLKKIKALFTYRKDFWLAHLHPFSSGQVRHYTKQYGIV